VKRGSVARGVGVLTILLAVVAGVAGSVQVAVMAKLGDRVGVFGAVAWAATLTAVLALAVLLVARQSLSPVAEAARQPLWLWSGAIMSVIIVLGITVAGSRIGVIATVAVLLTGQFAAGAVIDQYGLLGADRVPVNWVRVVGIALLAVGAALTLKR
jgi:bacterial/archaeal transporter family-2 protein